MRNYPGIGIQIPDILLPRPETDFQKWAVIACDQYTSEPEYWKKVKEIVGNSPSTFNMILPEVYLGKSEESEHFTLTQSSMKKYTEEDILVSYEGLILVKRTVDGKTRHGLMLALDLERYDFNKGSQSLIRATEGTIIDRLPPRMKIREGATLEMPHILVLIDDPQKTVIEPLVSKKDSLKKLYDFDLMLGSGHLEGYLIDDKQTEESVIAAIENLSDPDTFRAKYNVNSHHDVLLYAMGDGNHSLATAKAIWEKIKPQVGMDHPARYALVEIENVHDEGLVFEPIHRVLFDVKGDFQADLQEYFGDNFVFETVNDEDEMAKIVNHQPANKQAIGIVSEKGFGIAYIGNAPSNLPVGTIQAFLDHWLKEGKFREIDYVHGKNATVKLGKQSGNIGIFLPGMQKSDLFKTVILDGALPRKTFSMGEAHEKRFYMECKKIA